MFANRRPRIAGSANCTKIAATPSNVVGGHGYASHSLTARWLSVWGPITAMQRFRSYDDHTVAILTWGGLRGGLSVALALSLPQFAGREIVLGSTYAIVIFSILVQALTLGRVVRWLRARSATHRAGANTSSGRSASLTTTLRSTS